MSTCLTLRTCPDRRRFGLANLSRYRGAWAVLLLAYCLAATGCTPFFGMLAYGFFPPQQKQAYKLIDVPTLILVDDPGMKFQDPNASSRIADQIAFHLMKEGALSKSDLVPADTVNRLIVSLADEYSRTPIDVIGREVGAEQVIHVHVSEVDIMTGPQVMKPTAKLVVKVIATPADGRAYRLFPATRPNASTNDTAPKVNGYPVVASLEERYGVDLNAGNTRMVLATLADKAGRAAARAFFNSMQEEE